MGGRGGCATHPYFLNRRPLFSDLSQAHSGLDQILQQILTQPTFSEELKHAAAFSLGNIALGNLQHYMPTVLSCVNSFGKKRYLMFISLKEIIGEAISPDTQGQTPLDPFVDQIWNLLFTYLEEEMEEGTRSSISEVLGKLSTIRPAQFIEALRTKLVSNSANARATVVTAIRFTFNTYTKDVREFDELLKPIIIQFFALIKDSDLNVKKLALATLNSAAHNKPALLKKSLDDLLPLLYAETVVNVRRFTESRYIIILFLCSLQSNFREILFALLKWAPSSTLWTTALRLER